MQDMEQVQPLETEQSGDSADASLLLELQQENEELKRQLSSVVATAAANEKIWRHFAEIEKILFRTRVLDQLVEELLQEIKLRFEPDQVILLLCHPDILEHFFPNISRESDPVGEGAWVVPFPTEAGHAVCGDSPKPALLSHEDVEELLPYLPDDAALVRSAVLMPLCIHQVFFGGLFLGSVDAGRYRPEDGTDLLEQLAIKVALCMDNCLTYERVKDFAVRDSLTGLLNFFQIHTILEREFRKARRLGNPLSVLIMDPEFYQEEDEPSDIGNEILKHVADLLTGILPEGESVLGRYGSDEFLLILPNVGEDEAREVVPYLSQMIRKSPFKYGNTAILIQSLAGVGSLSEEMKRPQDLLDAAYTELCRLKVSR